MAERLRLGVLGALLLIVVTGGTSWAQTDYQSCMDKCMIKLPWETCHEICRELV